MHDRSESRALRLLGLDGKEEEIRVLLQKQVSKASIAKIVGVTRPLFTALSRQGAYAHILKGYFYTNLVGTPKSKEESRGWLACADTPTHQD